jgi:uncharacterized membrane protein YcjF (UPF0283 family)
MDLQGQKLAEIIYQVLFLATGVRIQRLLALPRRTALLVCLLDLRLWSLAVFAQAAGLVYGFFKQDFDYVVYSWVGTMVVALLVSVLLRNVAQMACYPVLLAFQGCALQFARSCRACAAQWDCEIAGLRARLSDVQRQPD